MKFLSDILARAGLVVEGVVTLNNVANATIDTDKFLTVDSGVVKFRTGAQLLSDIGGQALLTNPITGTGTAGQVAFYNGTTTITGDSDLYWDNTNKRLGVGAATPYTTFQVGSTSGAKYIGVVDTADTSYNIAYFGHNGTKLHIGFSNSNTSISERNAISIDSSTLYVGLGVSAPANRLQIGSLGSTGYSGNHLAFGNGTAATAFFQSNTSTQMYVSTYLALVGNMVIGGLTSSGFNLDVIGTFRATSTVTIGSIANATTNTDRYLVSDAGVIKYRTAAQLFADSGAQTALNGTGFVRMSGTTVSYITGTSSQFVKADGSLDSSTYLTSSALSSYVPYTGASTNVNLGNNTLSVGFINILGSALGAAGYLGLRQNASIIYAGSGYTSIVAEDKTFLSIQFDQDGGTNGKFARFNAAALTNNTQRTYSLPNASGTLALTSDIPTVAGVYLPLSGGTLTGALGGTSATFSTQLVVTGSTNEQLVLSYTAASGGFTWQSFRLNGTNRYRIFGNTDNSFTLWSDVLSSNVLAIASTGAATFSSSVYAGASSRFGFGSSGAERGSIALDGGFNWSFNTNSIGNAMYIQSTTGNVVIGNTVASNVGLTIYGANAATIYQTANTGTGAGNGFYVGHTGDISYIWNYNNYPTVFATNNTERMRITSGGNVGIGTTNPLSILHISGSDAGFRITGSSRAQMILTNGLSQWQLESPTGVSNVPAGAFGIIESGVGSRLTILTGGDVGIGTTAPLYRLEVQNSTGDDHIAAVGTAPSIQLMSANSGPANWGTVGMATATNNFLIGAAAGDLAIINRGSTVGSILFGFGSTERIRLISTGQLRLNAYTSSSAFTGTAVATLGVDSSGNVITVTGGGGSSQWTTSGSDIYYTTGIVGIGLTTGFYGKLSVSSGNFNGIRIDTNAGYDAISIGGTGAFAVDAPGIQGGRFYIGNGGNTGIGINNPTTKLDVRGNMLLKGDATDGGVLTITRRYSTGPQTINFNNNHPSTNLDWTGARITSADAGNYNGYLDFAVSLGNNGGETAGTAAVASVMRLTKDRRVGIGTTTPSYTLHVLTSDNEGIYLQGTGGGIWMNIKSAAGKMWSYGAQNDGCGIYNRTDGVYRMFITDSGATTFSSSVTAGGNFTTTADGGAGGLRLTLNNTGAGEVQYALLSGGSAGTGVFGIRNGSTGTNLFLMNSTGAATFASSVTCTSLTETSTIKVKENIVNVDSALDQVEKLQAVSYNRKGSAVKEIGLIAEAVEEIYPEFVQYDQHGEPVGLNYSRLTAVLIESVKELKNRIQQLENRN